MGRGMGELEELSQVGVMVIWLNLSMEHSRSNDHRLHTSAEWRLSTVSCGDLGNNEVRNKHEIAPKQLNLSLLGCFYDLNVFLFFLPGVILSFTGLISSIHIVKSTLNS